MSPRASSDLLSMQATFACDINNKTSLKREGVCSMAMRLACSMPALVSRASRRLLQTRQTDTSSSCRSQVPLTLDRSYFVPCWRAFFCPFGACSCRPPRDCKSFADSPAITAAATSRPKKGFNDKARAELCATNLTWAEFAWNVKNGTRDNGGGMEWFGGIKENERGNFSGVFFAASQWPFAARIRRWSQDSGDGNEGG